MCEAALTALDSFSDRVFSQRPHWLAFAAAICGGEVVTEALSAGGRTIGYLSGVKFHKFGIPIFGSPFPGWTTPYIGFNLFPGASRREALALAERLVFRELGCLHFEISDRFLHPEDGVALGFGMRLVHSYMSDLTGPEDQIFKQMSSPCRRAVRKAEKSGVRVEEAQPDGFAAEYYEQLKDVFAKQSLRPTYTRERVEQLIEHVHASGDLLLARALDPQGRSIATGIYVGFGPFSFFWGNASLREHQHLRPNEALHWFAMRYWKGRGMQWHDWGGGGTYKEKYGGQPSAVPSFFKSRWRALSLARSAARSIYYLPRNYRRSRYRQSIGRDD
jgi:hypothetical protein